MVHLTSRNLRALHDRIREIYSHLEPSSFPGHVVEAASRIIPADVVSFANIVPRKKDFRYIGQASCRTWEALDGFVRHMDEHPILNYLHAGQLKPHRYRESIGKAVGKRFPSLLMAQHDTAARISDALTDREFRSLGIYNEFFRKNAVDYQMLISFLPGRNGYSMLSFNRDRRDFSEEERLLLNLLGPHVAQAHRNAAACGRARSAFSALEGRGRMPAAYGLTHREEDVLYWVAQGKTNAETAKILKMAAGTVKVHLERIYQKLGVENRTAASVAAREWSR